MEFALSQKDDQTANFLFREAVRFRTIHNRDDAPTVDELFAFVGNHPKFSDIWQLELFCEIHEWRWNNIKQSEKDRNEQAAARSDRIHKLMKHLDQLRRGFYIDGLVRMAYAYFGHYVYSKSDLDPIERMTSFANSECSDAAIAGFVTFLRQPPPKLPSVELIAESKARSRYYHIGFVYLAGMDILSQRHLNDVLSLSDDVLSTSLTFHYAIRQDIEPVWVPFLFEHRKSLVSKVLNCYWRAHLIRKCDHVEGLYEIARNYKMAQAVREIVLPILQEFPNCNTNILENLLRIALSLTDKDVLLKLSSNVLNKPNTVKGLQRVLWYSVAFTLCPDEFKQKLGRFIGTDTKKAEKLISYSCPSRSDNNDLALPELYVSMIEGLVTICGKIIHYDSYSWHSDTVHAVRRLISRLASDVSDDAVKALNRINCARSLKPWHKTIADALAKQTQNRREAVFKYPSFDQVVQTLNRGDPANPADLQALVLDHLIQIGDDIHHGSTDGYKLFWNVDSHGRPKSHCPENTCRDRLLDKLKQRLAPLGFAAEPEGHYARDKRADIKVLYKDAFNLPVEIKGHYHSELWTAPSEQLQKLYSCDPGAGGRGIYLVLWFGLDHVPYSAAPPKGINKPQTPQQLENALRQVIPKKDRALIEFLVIDCSF